MHCLRLRVSNRGAVSPLDGWQLTYFAMYCHLFSPGIYLTNVEMLQWSSANTAIEEMVALPFSNEFERFEPRTALTSTYEVYA